MNSTLRLVDVSAPLGCRQCAYFHRNVGAGEASCRSDGSISASFCGLSWRQQRGLNAWTLRSSCARVVKRRWRDRQTCGIHCELKNVAEQECLLDNESILANRKVLLHGGQNGSSDGAVAESNLEREAWDLLRDAVVTYCGEPVGTIAANDPTDPHPLNYDQVFIRDFIPSAIAFLLKGETEIVRNFLLHTLQLQVYRPLFNLI